MKNLIFLTATMHLLFLKSEKDVFNVLVTILRAQTTRPAQWFYMSRIGKPSRWGGE
jgi:hypothetical protein